eukprot:2490164-Ditylum_brightwellii.AAC.1
MKKTIFLAWKSEGARVGSKSAMKLMFALPGNPVNNTVCADLLVRTCLDMLHGSLPPEYSSET